MFPRHITGKLREALSDTPVVFLRGARQTGKSTLARALVTEGVVDQYLTLDDPVVLAAAQRDPSGFIAGIEGSVTIDEVQRAPGLFRAIKARVDRRRRPGQFLLTGSANALLFPDVAGELVGRMEVLTLYPLSQGELRACREEFIDILFRNGSISGKFSHPSRQELVKLLLVGGYPEAVARTANHRRDAWFKSYVAAMLQREIRDLSRIEGIAELPRLLSLLATRITCLVNYADISRALAIPQSSLKRYFALLEMIFLVDTLPAWMGSVGRRIVKTPRLLFVDTGLAAHLTGQSIPSLVAHLSTVGPLLENFVVMELKKQATWCETDVSLYHFRAQSGQEVDIVMEDRAGKIVGVEVKASATISYHDLKGLQTLQQALPDRFLRGVVLYTGQEVVPFSPKLYAMPLTALWELRKR